MADSTEQLITLLGLPIEERSERWGWEVLEAVPDAHLKINNPEAQTTNAPNGLQYYFCYPDLGHGDPGIVARNSIEELTNGVTGLVLVQPEERVEFVVTPGDLAAFRMFGAFHVPDSWSNGGSESENGGDPAQVLLGSPSEEFLPSFLKGNIAAIYEFLKIENPEVVLAMSGGGSRSLAFNIWEGCSPYNLSVEAMINYVLEVLPRGYTLMAWDESFAGKGLKFG